MASSSAKCVASECLHDRISTVLQRQHGVVFAVPAIVHRGMYTGRGIIAPNTELSPSMADQRGYVPVEWWVMSKTEAKNAVPLPNEGVSSLLVDGEAVLLTECLRAADQELMGEYACAWPLTKVLDIGGTPRQPSYSGDCSTAGCSESEVPPIPCHVHAGEVVGGRCVGHGKTEAYFFPPLDVPPYNLTPGPVKTRLGLKPGTTTEQVVAAMTKFGESDDIYSLLNEYQIQPWESWTIEQKVIHAPGPWLTFEIQLPQDDFHLLAWVLGEKLPEETIKHTRDTYNLRGLDSERALLQETLDWEMNTACDFQERWWRKCETLSEGEWGRRVRLFYHIFYGEGLVVHPGKKYHKEADSRPFAGIVWSGRGSINGLELNCMEKHSKEFLVAPGHSVEIESDVTAETDLIVFSVFPLAHKCV